MKKAGQCPPTIEITAYAVFNITRCLIIFILQ